MAVATGGFIALDCADAQQLGRFWADMLGGQMIAINQDVVAVRTDWIWLTALRVPDYVAPTWPANDVPKQIHLDLAVTDLQQAVDEARRLGARVAADQPAPDRWQVLLDPAGHPICLTTQIPPAVIRPAARPDTSRGHEPRGSQPDG
jgi:hypothetical protein